MPTPYAVVKQAFENFDDAAFKTKVISEVDAALQDTNTLRWKYVWRKGEERFKFVVQECWLSDASKRDIEKQYKAAGWAHCEVKSSFEDRGAPGAIHVTLSARPNEPKRPG